MSAEFSIYHNKANDQDTIPIPAFLRKEMVSPTKRVIIDGGKDAEGHYMIVRAVKGV